MTELSQKLAELERKAELFDQNKQENKLLADKLQQAMALVEECKEKLYPTVNIAVANRKKRKGRFDEVLAELSNVMQAGTQVTRELVEKTYPDLPENKHNYILTKLRQMPGVHVAKDGRNVRLYV